MNNYVRIFALVLFASIVGSCNKDLPEDQDKNNEPKPEMTQFKFASTGVDCGAFTQDRIGAMIHINTEKCHNETYRPTITLNFASGFTFAKGNYPVGDSFPAEAGKVYITASDYMNPNLQPQIAWLGVEGSIAITINEEDPTKIDVEFKSIKMQNTSFAVTTDIPEFDTLTGFIIGI